MTRQLLVLAALCFAILLPIQAAETNTKVSPTFAELLTRVTVRDKDSGAIISVKPKSDAPSAPGQTLKIEMVENTRSKTVDIKLSTRSMNLNIYETYRLVIDDNICAELSKFKLMEDQRVQREILKANEAAARINRETQGKLKRGMTEKEVIAIIGPLTEINRIALIQQADFSTYRENDEFFLTFRVGLVDISRKKPKSSSE